MDMLPLTFFADFFPSGFSGLARERVYYGPDAAAAFDLVRDMRMTRDLLARLDAATAQRALGRLRETLTAHETSAGVLFASRAWIFTARRARRLATGYDR